MRSSTGAEASEVRPTSRCSLTSGVDVTAFLAPGGRDPFGRPGAFAGVDRSRSQRLQSQRLARLAGERAAEVMPVAAHGERGRTDRAAEVEGEDLRARDSAETAAPSAPAARTCRRRSARPPACGRRRRRAARAGTASRLRSAAKRSGGPSRCSLRSGPAQTAESGIMWARFRVEIGGWRTLA